MPFDRDASAARLRRIEQMLKEIAARTKRLERFIRAANKKARALNAEASRLKPRTSKKR